MYNSILRYSNALSINVVLGCFSCAAFFIEPDLLSGAKLQYLIILPVIVWLIYTADHIIDGYRVNGQSGILRYDYNYRNRAFLIPIGIIISIIIIWLIYKNRNHAFVENGIWLIPVLPVYYLLKLRGKLNPLVKMVIVSIIVSTVVVSLYNSDHIFSDFFSFERIIMMLLVFLNQLVLEHFEYKEEHPTLQPETKDIYEYLAKRIFVWIIIVLVITTILNPFAWMITLSIFLVSLFLRLIIGYQSLFAADRLYRYWADFSFILMWPLLRFFAFLNSLI